CSAGTNQLRGQLLTDGAAGRVGRQRTAERADVQVVGQAPEAVRGTGDRCEGRLLDLDIDVAVGRRLGGENGVLYVQAAVGGGGEFVALFVGHADGGVDFGRADVGFGDLGHIALDRHVPTGVHPHLVVVDVLRRLLANTAANGDVHRNFDGRSDFVVRVRP